MHWIYRAADCPLIFPNDSIVPLDIHQDWQLSHWLHCSQKSFFLRNCHKFSIDTPYYLLLGSNKIPKIIRWTDLQNLPYFFRRSSQSNGLCGALSPSPAIRFHPSLAPLQRHGDRCGAGDRGGAGGCQEEKRHASDASWPKRGGDGGNRWDLLRFKVNGIYCFVGFFMSFFLWEKCIKMWFFMGFFMRTIHGIDQLVGGAFFIITNGDFSMGFLFTP